MSFFFFGFSSGASYMRNKDVYGLLICKEVCFVAIQVWTFRFDVFVKFRPLWERAPLNCPGFMIILIRISCYYSQIILNNSISYKERESGATIS